MRAVWLDTRQLIAHYFAGVDFVGAELRFDNRDSQGFRVGCGVVFVPTGDGEAKRYRGIDVGDVVGHARSIHQKTLAILALASGLSGLPNDFCQGLAHPIDIPAGDAPSSQLIMCFRFDPCGACHPATLVGFVNWLFYHRQRYGRGVVLGRGERF